MGSGEGAGSRLAPFASDRRTPSGFAATDGVCFGDEGWPYGAPQRWTASGVLKRNAEGTTAALTAADAARFAADLIESEPKERHRVADPGHARLV